MRAERYKSSVKHCVGVVSCPSTLTHRRFTEIARLRDETVQRPEPFHGPIKHCLLADQSSYDRTVNPLMNFNDDHLSSFKLAAAAHASRPDSSLKARLSSKIIDSAEQQFVTFGSGAK
ncbi:hypothetical protein T12_4977 [Trichinella patagoniensis]|uniref:Uncharacterized protein n=1 Tax=Trichinella patagoniensis TaxID=990121 RepID=A0A0V0ZZ02_9BILA|nr:hypothetical protein T12_4977 [Trichinella patagoniensis]